jgi:RHS repeat-associated protein
VIESPRRTDSNHLNTPRLVADSTGTTVWRWDQQEPFGNNPADENPSGLGAFDLPLRLPGQRYDKETNLAYNMARDYDPAIGRYIQSDPIGLRGGINTYNYVGGSPLILVDPYGLVKWTGWYNSFSWLAYTRDEYVLVSECKCSQRVTVRVFVDSLFKSIGASSSHGDIAFEDNFDCPNSMAFAGLALGATAQAGIGSATIGGVEHELGVSCSALLVGVARSASCGKAYVGGLSIGAGVGKARVSEDIQVEPCGCDKQ